MGQHCIHSLAFKMKTNCFLSIWSTSELFNILGALVLLKLGEQTGFFLSVYSTHPTLAQPFALQTQAALDPCRSQKAQCLSCLLCSSCPLSITHAALFLEYSFHLKFLYFPFFIKAYLGKLILVPQTPSHISGTEKTALGLYSRHAIYSPWH